jgi:lipid-binding SYLF domain-containing protein
MAHEALAKLYQTQSSAKAALDGAAGYAVFRNFDLKMFVVGGGKGVGLALNNKNKKVTFMRMAELQAGLGLGKVHLIWVFENKKAFDHFVKSGFELGAQASEAAKAADSGSAFQGAVPVADGIWLYQLGDHGLAPELTVKGTKYYKDKDLN